MAKVLAEPFMVDSSRRFLFLQGLRSPFFHRLATALRSQGQVVDKVHFNVGDEAYWQGEAIRCLAPERALPGFYQSLFDGHRYTDVVLFGDCRPVHRPAIARARSLGMAVHVFEEGYFRPDWVTLEVGGVNGYSFMPKSASWYRKVASRVLELPVHTPLPSGFKARVWHDIIYNIACIGNIWRYPNYSNHVPYPIHDEYLAYARRAVMLQRKRGRDAGIVRALCEPDAAPFFLLALQIKGDSQLRFHSDYADPFKLLSEVITSFALHAPPDTKLLIKNHPLDPGMTDYPKMIREISGECGVSDRVLFIETGHLPTLLERAKGMVTVNSTTIGQALFRRCPVKPLGRSIFDMSGLTFQGDLDTFWIDPSVVDRELFVDVQRVFTHVTQIHGGLHSKQGIEIAVSHAMPRLMETDSRLAALLREVPLESVT